MASKPGATVTTIDKCDLSDLSEVSRIEHAISWKDADQRIDEYGNDDDDVEWHTCDDGDDLEESAHTVGPPTDDPELLE